MADTQNGAEAGIAAGHAPPYQFDAVRGYQSAEQQPAHDPHRVADSEIASEEDESSYDSSADEISDTDLAGANPQDYTKSYNRQRRMLDPSVPVEQKPKANPQKPKANVAARIDDQISSLSKHAGKLKLNDMSAGLGAKGESKGDKDRADRATSEQVLDPRTRMILLQMINRGIVSEVNGCVSTGKEANVYHSVSEANGEPFPVAIKIFKTAILTFKARSAYLEGEFRFKSGFKHRSNHAMVRMWAEKEYRNLKRLHAAGLPVPEPLYLRAHVLAMRFVGSKKGWSAPLLRDVAFTDDDNDAQWPSLHRQVLRFMRTMYQSCRLVHADLSEYNMLFNAGKLWVIDVGQAVEHDHPRSLEFLRTDIKNVTHFFASKSVPVLSEQGVFGFITADKGPLDQAGMDRALDELAQVAAMRPEGDDDSAKLDSDTAVFRDQYIPQTLDQVFDIERDADKIHKGEGSDLVYQSLLANGGSKTDGAAAALDTDSGALEGGDEDASGDSGDDSDESDESDESDAEHSADDKKPRGKRFEDKSSKKEHKAAVKEEKREKRKTKMPKKEKKRLVNKGGRK